MYGIGHTSKKERGIFMRRKRYKNLSQWQIDIIVKIELLKLKLSHK